MYVPFELPVIRPDFFGDLSSNVPGRLVTWSVVKMPWQITASPVLDLHRISLFVALQYYVGAPDSLRFPMFFSIHLKLSKDFRIPFSGVAEGA